MNENNEENTVPENFPDQYKNDKFNRETSSGEYFHSSKNNKENFVEDFKMSLISI